MTYQLIRLNFGRSPTHFGETGIGLEQTSERIRSDALFSAWVSAYARLFGGADVETLLHQCQTPKPPFRLSSTFVYRRDPDQPDQFIDYLPTPIQRPIGFPSESERELKIAKTYKKIHYLPLTIWQRWYQGSGFSDSDYDALVAYGEDPEQEIKKGLATAGTFGYKNAFKRYELPKVAIDRTSRATNFYHTGLHQFDWRPDSAAENGVTNLAGLYFLVDFKTTDATLKNNLMAALHLLGEDGIGGERSSGAGRFKVELDKSLLDPWPQVLNPPNIASETALHSLISLYWENPVPESLLGEATCYTLIERGGWIASPVSGRQLRRQKVHMFAEGSVFTGEPEGKLAVVTPKQFKKHPIYRSGLALSLAVKS